MGKFNCNTVQFILESDNNYGDVFHRKYLSKQLIKSAIYVYSYIQNGIFGRYTTLQKRVKVYK